jgi:hypothetical protein
MTITGRYHLRKEIDGTWTVFDIFTGLPTEINGVPIMRLDIEEADDAIDLLNTLDVERQQNTEQ